MKNIIFFLVVIFSTINSFSQFKSKVQLVNGVEVYLIAEPLREYEILEETSKSVQIGSPLTRGLLNASISTRVSKYINKVKREFQKKGEVLEAVMYIEGKSINAIRFISPPTDENYRIGIIRKVSDIPFFVMSTPVDEYKEVSKIWNGVKLKSFATLGIANNSIEKDLKEFAKWAKSKYKKGKISALMYSQGKKAASIKF